MTSLGLYPVCPSTISGKYIPLLVVRNQAGVSDLVLQENRDFRDNPADSGAGPLGSRVRSKPLEIQDHGCAPLQRGFFAPERRERRPSLDCRGSGFP